MPKISVIMPVYNGEKFLRGAIESVLAQTFQDWELRMVDDGSTDSSREIMREYVQKDNRIHMIENETNLKLPMALNVGFRQAEGEYYTWTSDDNLYDADALEVMVSFLENNPMYGMIYCDIRHLDENGTIQNSEDAREVRCLYSGSYAGACFLYRKQVAQAVGEYDPSMFLVEDYDYWLRISKQCPLYYLPQCKYTYRVHRGSLSWTREQQVRKQLYRLRQRELDYLLQKTDEEETQFLFLDMWAYRTEETWGLRNKFFPQGLPERLKWLERYMAQESALDPQKKVVLFGAGDYGKRALRYLGRERIYCFADNNPELAGTTIENVPVISFQQMKKEKDAFQIVVSVATRTVPALAAQLEAAGITNYILFVTVWESLAEAYQQKETGGT